MTASSKDRTVRRVHVFLVVVVVCLAGVIGYTLKVGGAFNRRPHIAFVVGGTDPFFDIAVTGARDAAEGLGAQLDVFVPAQSPGTEDQDRILRELINQRLDGIAISPSNPYRQRALLRDAAAKTHLITFDADAPVCHRLCYVGTDNYAAGQTCAKLVKEALPNGGKIMISVGDLSADNGQRRRQGVIDELLERSYEPARPSEPLAPVLAGSKYTIVATLVDKDNRPSARETVVAAIKAHPDVNGLIGLYAYNGPAILDALKETGKLGQIKVVAFDFDEDTLAGVEAGHIHGTVVQDPYAYGYRTVAILAGLARGEEALPMFQIMSFDCKPIQKADVAELRTTVQQRLRRAQAGG
jgi:ribose transport system substrate-binding protein